MSIMMNSFVFVSSNLSLFLRYIIPHMCGIIWHNLSVLYACMLKHELKVILITLLSHIILVFSQIFDAMRSLSRKQYVPYVRAGTYTEFMSFAWTLLRLKWLKLTQNSIILNVYKWHCQNVSQIRCICAYKSQPYGLTV